MTQQERKEEAEKIVQLYLLGNITLSEAIAKVEALKEDALEERYERAV